MKKSGIYKRMIAVVAILLIAAVLVWSSGWRYSRRGDGGVVDAVVVLSPESAPAPGAPVSAVLTMRLPLWRKVSGAELSSGKGSVLSGAVSIKSSWRWSYRIWQISATLRPLSPAGAEAGKLTLAITPGESGQPDSYAAVIPPFQVKKSAATEEKTLLLADREEEQKSNKIHLLWLLLLILPVAWLIWRLFRKKKEETRIVPPWERAVMRLQLLRERIAEHAIEPVAGVNELTDVVRSYLEERFALPAPRLTTAEFLRTLAADPDKLISSDRLFLREFMTAADLVKFACAPAAAEQLERAIAQAETLVEHTVVKDTPEVSS